MAVQRVQLCYGAVVSELFQIELLRAIENVLLDGDDSVTSDP